MKTVGVIGGIGPESTIEYYRQLIAAYRAQHPDGTYPPIVINSVNLKTLVDLFEANDLAKVTNFWWLKFGNWRRRARSTACSPPTRRTLCSTRCAAGRRSHWSAS